MLAKLVDGRLEYIGKEIVIDGRHVRGFTDKFLKEQGYKEVEYVKINYDDYSEEELELLEFEFVEADNKIVQVLKENNQPN